MSARTITVWHWDGGCARRVSVTAYPTPVAGLVINSETKGRGWAVTHAASGACVLLLPDPESALHGALHLESLADWTLPGTALQELPGLEAAVHDLARKLDCHEETFCGVPALRAEHLAAAESGGAS